MGCTAADCIYSGIRKKIISKELQKGQRLAVDVVEDLHAKVADHRLADLLEEEGVEVVEDSLEKEDDQHHQRQHLEEKDVLFHEDLVEQVLDEIGLGTGEAGDEDHRQHGDEKFDPVGTDDEKESVENFCIAHAIKVKCRNGGRPLGHCRTGCRERSY